MPDLTTIRKMGNRVFEFAHRQLRQLASVYPNTFPTFTQNGKWVCQDENWTQWCDGFLGGLYWLVYLETKDPWFRGQAEHYTLLLEKRKSDRTVHDLGFLFLPTWKRWYGLTGDKDKNEVVIEAGRTLAERFQEKGGYLCSFEGEHSLYIDIMMNVELLYYTAQQHADDQLFERANRHCLTTRRTLLRGDGSTAHTGIFNPENGEFISHLTRQGWRNDSTWARGQAWALYGFGTAYSYSQDLRMLKAAEAAADYVIERSPSNGIPHNDWEEPAPKYRYESSAAAIGAGGLWNLSKLVGDGEKARLYKNYALNTLKTLAKTEFLANETPGWEGILKHGIYNLPKGVGVDESVIWGDYYFLEALHNVLSDPEELFY